MALRRRLSTGMQFRHVTFKFLVRRRINKLILFIREKDFAHDIQLDKLTCEFNRDGEFKQIAFTAWEVPCTVRHPGCGLPGQVRCVGKACPEPVEGCASARHDSKSFVVCSSWRKPISVHYFNMSIIFLREDGGKRSERWRVET